MAGLVLGWLACRAMGDFVWILWYHYKYRSETAFLGLYDVMDDEYGYGLVKTRIPSLRTYAKYIALHQAARLEAYV